MDEPTKGRVIPPMARQGNGTVVSRAARLKRFQVWCQRRDVDPFAANFDPDATLRSVGSQSLEDLARILEISPDGGASGAPGKGILAAIQAALGIEVRSPVNPAD